MAGTYYARFRARIGIVCDEILWDSFSPAAELVYLPPTEAWRERIQNIDLLLVVSTWRGIENNDWRGLGLVGDPKRKILCEIIAACRARGIPTVFYSKEDPPNYRVFLDFARACDYVFTSAEEMIPQYRQDCGHERVSVLPFCANPEMQNPIGCGTFPHAKGAVFAGSWIIKYPFRCRDLAALLDGAVASRRGLEIVDRNSFRTDNSGYRYPGRFACFVHPALPHHELMAVHKECDWSLNVNSVTTSSSMFAGRCYELLACGCPVLSNFSCGMLQRLPEVAIADTAEYAQKLVASTTARDLQIRRAAGIRRVMTGETCYDRVSQILRAVGLPADLPRRRVVVVIPPGDMDLQRCFARQTYVDRCLLETENPDHVDTSGFDYVAVWNAGMHYGPYFLQDLIDAFKYTDATFATEGEPAYGYVNSAVPGRTVFRCSMMKEAGGRGFCVPPSVDSEEEVQSVINATHEITEPVPRSLKEVRPPVWVRAKACLDDNGLWYTIKRMLFGRQY